MFFSYKKWCGKNMKFWNFGVFLIFWYFLYCSDRFFNYLWLLKQQIWPQNPAPQTKTMLENQENVKISKFHIFFHIMFCMKKTYFKGFIHTRIGLGALNLQTFYWIPKVWWIPYLFFSKRSCVLIPILQPYTNISLKR